MYEKIKSMYKAVKNKATEIAVIGAIAGLSLLPGCGNKTKETRFYDPDLVVNKVMQDLQRAEQMRNLERSKKRLAAIPAEPVYVSDAEILHKYGFSPEEIVKHCETSNTPPQPRDDLVWEKIIRENKAQNKETWPVNVNTDLGNLVCKETESDNN